MKIIENEKVRKYLRLRNLEKQFKKCRADLENENLQKVNFKKLQPKWMNIFSFRINRQFRAFGIFRDGILRIYKISDHQN